ncbi:MAG: glycosyltransferase family 8 protein [Lachnospiraceae bacterium]|nr:glycosyltransferase family 8 protein [Lachnospiraceae bacterium]MDY5701538.1 glycosyltransferase family 8 protein [Lachnospiraceae bacterium]
MYEKKIPIVMISDDNFIMQTSVAITSLLKNKSRNTVYEVFVIMAECSKESEEILRNMNAAGSKINLVHASLEQYRDIKQLAHISIACLLKFDICELLPGYDKLIYLDGDVIVRKDLTELFNIDVGDNYAAAVKELYCMKKDDGCINAGIMVFNAKKMREDGMRDILVAERKSLGNRSSMDQQTYNRVIKNHIYYLSIIYNCVPGRLQGSGKLSFTMDELNSLYGTDFKSPRQLIKNAAIIHFATGNKPWKYTFAPCAKEWYTYYLLSPFGDRPFKRYGRWGYRFHHMSEILKKGGVKAVICYLRQRANREEEKKTVDWD